MAIGSRPREDSLGAIADAVFEQVRRVLPPEADCQITLDRSLHEIGLDSLTRMDVLNRLEEAFGLRFSEESLYDMQTCRDVVEYIEANAAGGGLPRPSLKPSAAPTPVPADPPAVVGLRHQQGDVTQFPECLAFRERLAGSAAAGLENPFFRCKDRVDKAAATIAGREVVSYTSFDYLGLAGHPRVIAAAKEALDRFGASASASRLVGGNHAIVQQLDDQIARFLGTEAAIVFPSGYGTNASVFGHLFGPEDLILYDELAHNSIVQGALLSKAQRRCFPHNDFRFLNRLLGDIRGNYRRVVVAVEGVYSMDGDYPDLPQFIEVKRRHRALLYVDEAHSIGVMGPTGRGLCEHFGVDPGEGDLWMGTISKALASGGGYLAGREILMEYLKYTTPAFVFATAISPANAAAALEAIRLVQEEPERVARLRERSQLFLKLADDSGLDTGPSGDTPVIPIILGDSRRCIQVVAKLLLEGIDAQPILYPAVPESKSRIRFFVTAEHTEEQICRTVQVLADCVAAS
jgi:8-amino-7-oxononanoate synthase/acyl carrier protein